jgi:hypothetical protein
MKKLILFIAVLALVALPAASDFNHNGKFVATDIATIAAGATAVNVSNFTASEIKVPMNQALVTIYFTITTGSATLTVDFYFQVSYDGGTTWADYVEYFSVESGHAAITGTTVRVAKPITLIGVSHIRLSKIVNNDVTSGHDLTAVNAVISW